MKQLLTIRSLLPYIDCMDTGGAERPAISRRGALGAIGAAAGLAVLGSPLLTSSPALAVGAWGGYSNGAIPVSALAPIPGNSVLSLRGDAVQALMKLNEAFKKNFGRNLPINSAYRDLAQQEYWVKYWADAGIPGNAAPAGSSNHGWALAMDIGVAITDWTNPYYLWMKSNAGKYSWVHPSWAEPGGAHPEAWHWEYTGSYVPTKPPETEEEDDMANVITVSVPDGGTGQVWWSVNLEDNTKARIWNGTQLTFRRNIGIAEYANQPPQTLQGFKDISTT